MMLIETRHMTVEEFDRWVLLPENADRSYEYILGEVVEVVSNNYSSQIGILVGGLLAVHVNQNRLGFVTGADGGYMVMGERYIPDAAFISKTRQSKPSRAAYNPLSPDLVIEVLSPTNDDEQMRVKIANYLAAGAVVWLFDPDKQQVEVYILRQKVLRIGKEGVLDGGDILPGFQIALKDVFIDEETEDA
jgi:Uma2 family endonuclease